MTPEGKPHPSTGIGTPSGAMDTSDALAEFGPDLVRKWAGGRERRKETRKERKREGKREREREREGRRKKERALMFTEENGEGS